jgi:hypothetical protein
MPIFALKPIESIKGKQKFYKLFKDDQCEFDKFCKELGKDNTYKSELNTLYSYMNYISNLASLPNTKFKPISKGKNEQFREYELKSKNLRIYLFHEENTGKIVVFGGTKNTQESDIKHFRKIKEEYIHYTKGR